MPILKSTLKITSVVGIRIVKNTKIKSILRARFLSMYPFLLKITEKAYNTVFIILELNILVMLVVINPEIAEKQTVKSSGIDVAAPAIIPTDFGFRFNVSANLRSKDTNTYLDIATIINVNNIK